MLNKHQKLALRKERTFFSSAQRIHKQNYSVFWSSNETRLLMQVIIAKRAWSNAVERNFLKRNVSTVLKQISAVQPTAKFSLVVVVKNKRCLQELDSIETDILQVIKK